MTDDIVDTMKHFWPVRGTLGHQKFCYLWHDACAIDRLISEIERLRIAGDELVAVMQSGSDSGWDSAIDTWKEVCCV